MPKWVYQFNSTNCEGTVSQKPLLGGKGANLAEMGKLGLPVPEKFRWAIIRGLFGLDVVEEEGKESFIYLKSNSGENQKRVFKNKEFVFLWGRTEHKVENHLSKPRYMICFDEEIEKDYLRSL